MGWGSVGTRFKPSRLIAKGEERSRERKIRKERGEWGKLNGVKMVHQLILPSKSTSTYVKIPLSAR